jgi:hypothetical protein
MRGVVAATAGVGAAATGHALDAAGQLPFVHEAMDVRTAMSPLQVLAWLAVAAAVSALAASTRVILVGVPGALIVTAAPELISRHDPGAVAEPGALVGALVQVLLLVTIVAMALVLERRVVVLKGVLVAVTADEQPQWFRAHPVVAVPDSIAAPRGPPRAVVLST